MIFNYSNEEVNLNKESIFLAGPTNRIDGNITNISHTPWRIEAVNMLKELGFDGVVYIPELNGAKWTEEIRPNQIKWEWKAMDNAACVLFWVPRCIDPDRECIPGFTTNIEFGRYTIIKPNQIAYGHPVNADKMEYMDYLFEHPLPLGAGRKWHDSLQATVEEAVDIIKRYV